MLEKLKFSLGNGEQGYKVISLESSGDHVSYEIIHSGLLPIDKGIHKASSNSDWLAAWDTLGVSAWNEEYIDPKATHAEEWRLTIREDGITYKSGGSGAYPEEWTSFLEWLDALMPEMEFIAPDRIEGICLTYEKSSEEGVGVTENLRLDRKEKRIVVQKCKKWRSQGTYCQKSSHISLTSHDFITQRRKSLMS